MLVLRRADAADLDFLVHADLQEEGYTRSEDEERESAAEHREKMGYREIRRGPIWDEVVRVSLVKEVDFS